LEELAIISNAHRDSSTPKSNLRSESERTGKHFRAQSVWNSFRNAVYVRTGNPVDYIDLPFLRTVILRLSQQPAKAWKRRRPQGASSKRVDLAPEQILQAASDGSC